MKRITGYEEIKENIICRIINENNARHLSEDVITFGYLDFTVAICVEVPEEGRYFCLTGKEIKDWGIAKDEIINIAVDNTYAKNSFRFYSLMCLMELIERYPLVYIQNPSVLFDIAEKNCFQTNDGMYLVSNSNMRNGACVLLYPKKLDEFAQHIDSDLIILPSSLNELIILAQKEWTDYDELSSIVAYVNDSCVSDEELFTYTIYNYDRSLHKLRAVDI